MDGEIGYDRSTGEIVDQSPMQPMAYRWATPCDAIFAALALAQASIENVEKGGVNPAFKSSARSGAYVTLGDVLDEVRPKLTAQGIAVIQMPINGAGSNIGVVTLLAHKSGQWIESTLFVAPTRFDAQGAGSVVTYLRRYALMAMAGVAPDDDDGNAAIGRPSETPSAARQTQGGAPAARVASGRPQAAPAPSEARANAAKRINELKLEIAASMTAADAVSWRKAPAWEACTQAIIAAKAEEGASHLAALDAAAAVMDELSDRIDRRVDMLNDTAVDGAPF
jgi:hypothetical protein